MNAAVAFLCVAAAFACALADSALLRASIDEGDALPRPEHEALHRALLFGRVVAHLGAGAAAWRALEGAVRPGWALWIAALACALGAVAVAEAAARELGDALGALGPAAAARVAPVGRAAALLLAPALWLGARLDAALRRVLPPLAPDAAREEATEQFREIVAAEAEGGAGEGALIAGVFALGDTPVSEVMVPRVDVVGLERTTPWAEVVARVRSAEHSRVPVFDETIDDVVGVLYAKDVLSAVVAGDEPEQGWAAALVRPAQFVPATKRIDSQLRDFRASGNHMAVVADEYGGTAGIVTIEDVLEEIVGEIRDERDEEEPPVEARDGRRFWVSARLTLDELSEALGHEFAHDEVATVGGLVYEVLGRVPRNGERLTIGPFRVIVERVVRRKIQRLYFERVEPEDAGEADRAGAATPAATPPSAAPTRSAATSSPATPVGPAPAVPAAREAGPAGRLP